MNIVDIAIIFIIVFCTVLAFSRGGIREIMILIKWVGSVWGASFFGRALMPVFFSTIPSPWGRYLLSYGSVFLLFFLGLNYLSYALTRIVSLLGLGILNRLIGMILGATEGLIIVMVLVMMLHYTPFVENDLWKHSYMVPQIQHLTALVMASVAHNFKVGI